MSLRSQKPIVFLLAQALFFLVACNGNSTADQKEAGGTKSSKSEKITKLVNAFVENGDFNGAILVSENNELVYKSGFGYANMEWDVLNKTDTKFRIGSISKQFTAMLILQLVAENKLDLHTPISNYLPDYPSINGDQITIHHLLTHSAGIPNSYPSIAPKKKKGDMIIPDRYSSQELVNEFSALALDFSPGEKFSYSNAGYTLLGYIAETISNSSYEQLLQDKIFSPLGMKNSGYDKHRAIIKNRASGYFKSWGTYYNANYTDMSKPYAAGGLYATVDDLFLWNQALYSEKLLEKKYLDLMFTSHIPDPDYGGDYAYGWSIKDKALGNSGEMVETIFHDGVIDGFCAIITRVPDTNATVICLSNIRRSPLNAITKAIMGILYEKPYDFPRKSLAYAFLDHVNETDSVEGIQFYKTNLNNKAYYLSEDEINIISYKLLNTDRAQTAAKILILGIESFPEAFNLYDSLGEIYIALDDKEAAIKSYKKSIELNPDNTNGIRMLSSLGVELD